MTVKWWDERVQSRERLAGLVDAVRGNPGPEVPAEPDDAYAAPYALFAGGPTYRPVRLADLVGGGAVAADYPDVTVTGDLAPTPPNPLGVFVHDEGVRIEDARVDGTVAARSLTLAAGARLSPVAPDPDARVAGSDADGPPLDPAAWPRPPAAVVRESVRAERGSAGRAGEIHVRGALVCDGPVVVEAGDVLEEQPTWGVLTDRAPEAKANGDLVVRLDLETARPAGAANDYTDAFVLRFGDEPDVWPVESYKHSNGKLTLAGAAGAPGAVPGAAWTLTSAKGRRTVFHGPVVARTVTVEPPPAWADLDKLYWESAHKIWRDGGKSGEFAEFLARPANWPAIFEATWGKGAAPLPGTIWHTGLSPVPTVLFTHRPEAGGRGVTAFAPPLFAPDPAVAGDAAGLRWEVLDWEDAARAGYAAAAAGSGGD